MKILVAHDDADLLAATTEALRRAGHRIVAPNEGREPADDAADARPDLILRNVRVRTSS